MGNASFAVMTGYSDEEMIGKTRDFTGAETDMETVQYERTNLKGLPLVVKLLITLKGEKYWVNIGASFI
jgi:PAS domain-containing protein